jgi:hypothetical protein
MFVVSFLSNWLVGFMVFTATFNNISVISWQSVLLVEKTRVLGENHRSVASHWQTLLHNVVSSTPRLSWIWTRNVGYKSNNHGRTWPQFKFGDTQTSRQPMWGHVRFNFQLNNHQWAYQFQPFKKKNER